MQDWTFWTAAAVMALAVLAVLVQAMRQAPEAVEPAGSADLRIYRDQLAEIERDVARGTLPQAEAARLRTEVSRRLLEADRLAQTAGAAPSGRRHGLALGLLVLSLAGAVWLYDRLGAPGYPDLPLQARLAVADQTYANRPSQAEAEAAAPVRTPVPLDPAYAALMEQLRTAVTQRPDDLRGLELLARNEASLGNFIAAKQAQIGVIAAKGADVTAQDQAALAEIAFLAAGGVVTAEVEQSLVAALQADPRNGTARYYSGLMFAQIGRPDRTFALWQPLLAEGPPDAPWTLPIRAQIEAVAQAAGIRFTLPPEGRGPDAGDIAAAGEMTEDERQAMIGGMVAQLSDRLARDGGPIEDWNRLIRSLVVLERRDDAQAIYDEAKLVFEGLAAELSFLRLAAVETGLVP